MSKIILRRVLISVCSVFLALVLGITLYFVIDPFDKQDNMTQIVIGESEDGVSVEHVSFEAPKIHPGETASHIVNLTGEIEGRTKVQLLFKKDTTKTNDLAQYIIVTVKINEEKYCEMLLSDIFSKTLGTVDCEMSRTKPIVIEIAYSMPIEIGNEAADTEAFFDLMITSSNE